MTLAEEVVASRRGPRVVLTFADQVVSSGANFATGVVIARLSGAEEFGAYALVLTAWLAVVGLHRALIAEPVTVASRDVADARSIVASGAGAEILFGLAVTALVALVGLVALAAGSHLAPLMLALAPWLVFLVLQDYWRAMAFRARQPRLALLNDVVFTAVQVVAIVAFIALGWRSPAYVITAWGLGAGAGALLGFRWFPLPASLREGWRLLRRLWGASRWLSATFVTSFASDQAYIVFLAVLFSPTQYGGFRAAISLMGPAYVIAQAAGNLGLPEAARRAGDPDRLDRFSRRLSVGTALCFGAYWATVAVGGGPVLAAVYGPEFAGYAPIATLVGAGYVLRGAVFGQGIALKATNRMRGLWWAQVGVIGLSFAVTIVLVSWLGSIGAGWAGAVTHACFAAGVWAVYRSVRRRGRRSGPSSGEARVADHDVGACDVAEDAPGRSQVIEVVDDVRVQVEVVVPQDRSAGREDPKGVLGVGHHHRRAVPTVDEDQVDR